MLGVSGYLFLCVLLLGLLRVWCYYSWLHSASHQVSFDPAKESVHVLSKTDAYGPEFRILGVIFDSTLEMASAVDEVVNAAKWKLLTLIKTRRYYTDAELVSLYKAHLLSYLEYRTPAIYHATREILERLDRIQTNFLRNAGIDDITALLEFNLAPLASRRDMAMLGLIHRTVIGKGLDHFKEIFKKRDGRQLEDPRRAAKGQLIMRSALGLVAVYNMLPLAMRKTNSVKSFQSMLQSDLKLLAEASVPDWQKFYSPRIPLEQHPLRHGVFESVLRSEVETFLDSSEDDVF